ncbi:MAG: helix-turn-helix domain-containing protein [Acidobacteriota bacterium]|nr:helix-turn-helix domain-containing protein [Acidobacteriota bacterium]
MGQYASDPLDDLAPLFSQRRAELGLSLREVSAQCGVPVATLSRVEQGRTPDLTTFRRIVEWLGLPPERFLNPTTRSVSTPEVISEHLRLDPTLSPDDVEKIAGLVRTMYDALQKQDRRLAVHLRAARTFTPPAMRLLGDLLIEMQEALETSPDWD